MYLPGCPDDGICYYEFAPLILVGIGFSLYIAVFWGSIPMVVETKITGTAFGICQSLINIGLSYAPWQINKLESMKKDSQGDGIFFMGADLFYIGSNIAGLLLAFFLFCWDKYHCEGRLNSPFLYYYDYSGEEEEENEETEYDSAEHKDSVHEL